MTRNVRMYNPTHRYDTTGESGPTGKPTVQWSYELDTDTREIAVWDDQVYVMGRDGNIGSISAFGTGGDLQWRFQTAEKIYSSPAVVDDTVYIGTWGNDRSSKYTEHVHAIDAASGTEQWSFQTDAGVEVLPAVVDSTVYIGSRSGHFYALDAVSGNQQWSFKIDLSIRSSPAVVDGTVHVGSIDRHVYAIDATSGTEQWCFQTEGSVRSSPVVKKTGRSTSLAETQCTRWATATRGAVRRNFLRRAQRVKRR